MQGDTDGTPGLEDTHSLLFKQSLTVKSSPTCANGKLVSSKDPSACKIKINTGATEKVMEEHQDHPLPL